MAECEDHATGDKSRVSAEEHFEMRKEIGVWSGVAIMAGSMVGSGIFITPVGVLEAANGSVGVSLLLWVACGLLTGLAALCYAELGTSVRESGGEFAYINAAYGGVFAFLNSTTAVLLIWPAGSASRAIVLGTYVVAPFYGADCPPSDLAIKCAAAACLGLVGFLNYVSVKAAARTSVIFTFAKYLAMGIIIVGGLVHLCLGNPIGHRNFNTAFNSEQLSTLTFTSLGLGFYQGLFSYDGWSNLNVVSEEIKDVGKNLPRCIIISVSSVMAFYVLVNIAYLSALTPNEMMASKAVAATFGDRVLGGTWSWIMPLSVCLSVFGALNSAFLCAARVPFAAARRGQFPQIFSMISVRYMTPAPALLLQTTLATVLMATGTFDALINATTFTGWIFYGSCAAGVLILRKTRPDLKRPYKVPFVIPIIVVICSIYLVVAPLIDHPDISYLYVAIFLACTPVLYYPLVYKKYRIPGHEGATKFLQTLLEVAPTDWKAL